MRSVLSRRAPICQVSDTDTIGSLVIGSQCIVVLSVRLVVAIGAPCVRT